VWRGSRHAIHECLERNLGREFGFAFANPHFDAYREEPRFSESTDRAGTPVHPVPRRAAL